MSSVQCQSDLHPSEEPDGQGSCHCGTDDGSTRWTDEELQVQHQHRLGYLSAVPAQPAGSVVENPLADVVRKEPGGHESDERVLRRVAANSRGDLDAFRFTWSLSRSAQDIGRALSLGRGGASRADHVSVRVKTSALYMSGYLDAAQQFWVKMHDGQWLACRQSS